ncbi:MAG: PAS domain-containing sensor histidine kinase [Rhodospirillales bacterium]|nr:MAG: PAS domain-containing sensor histidine kinase [Rhodospirillales bacterium]
MLAWSRRVGFYRKTAQFLAVAAVASGTATVAVWTGTIDPGERRGVLVALLLLDLSLLLMLGALVAFQVVKAWAERRRGLAGAGLHVRLVLMFSLVAVTPAILVAVFSALFLNFGLQAWFSERVRTAVIASNAVAEAYLEEHQKSIVAEALALANDLNRDAPVLMANPDLFSMALSEQADLRSLPEALVVDSNARVLARTPLSLSLELDLVPRNTIERAAQGQVAVISDETASRVRAVVRLNRFIDAYLVVGRFIDPEVLGNIERTSDAVSQYQHLEQQREGILITFVMIFVVVALLLLMAAAWTGLALATQISKPVSHLIAAADRIRKGDLGVRVDTTNSVEELDTLGRAFNRMTGQLESQRQSLVVANRQLDDRRRFTETVLSGVSAGVVGLDRDGLINLPNRSASVLLHTDLSAEIGRPLKDVAPEMRELLDLAISQPDRTHEAEIRPMREDGPRTLIARVVAERVDGEVFGYVVTLDDITALVSAQRKAAWADVARRIAHEIKNPLTPIQLAAERLQRKYQRDIVTDADTFKACTGTIIRRVEDIRRMVDEFSSFARMPRPDLKPENLSELVRQAVFLERSRNPHIRFDAVMPSDDVVVVCDGRQIAQALTNVLKNAAEAVEERGSSADAGNLVDGRTGEDGGKSASHPGRPEPGRVVVGIERLTGSGSDGPERIAVSVDDNGRGLPMELRDRITEPYVTTRAKGTGLGLAIVKKIAEDHSADLTFEDRPEGGTRVRIIFQGAEPSGQTASAATDHAGIADRKPARIASA